MFASFVVGDLVVGAGGGLGFGLGLAFCCLELHCVSSMYTAVLAAGLVFFLQAWD